MWLIRSWSPSSSGSTWAGARVVPEPVPGSLIVVRLASVYRIAHPERPGHPRARARRPRPYAAVMSRRTLLLASGSPARLRLLREAGFDPKVLASGVPEDDVDTEDIP